MIQSLNKDYKLQESLFGIQVISFYLDTLDGGWEFYTQAFWVNAKNKKCH